mmetsp:Transcript_60845/g.177839  ORF Transcript_60845/g.177839 Transcript_60845/m.177839 type:complete len:245 (-) Transcript_60845:70-804(-)
MCPGRSSTPAPSRRRRPPAAAGPAAAARRRLPRCRSRPRACASGPDALKPRHPAAGLPHQACPPRVAVQWMRRHLCCPTAPQCASTSSPLAAATPPCIPRQRRPAGHASPLLCRGLRRRGRSGAPRRGARRPGRPGPPRRAPGSGGSAGAPGPPRCLCCTAAATLAQRWLRPEDAVWSLRCHAARASAAHSGPGGRPAAGPPRSPPRSRSGGRRPGTARRAPAAPRPRGPPRRRSGRPGRPRRA